MSIVKLFSRFIKSNTGKSLAGGLATFIGFEWITGGGLVDSAAGTLGVTDSTATLIVIAVCGIGAYFAIKWINSKIPAKQPSKRS